MIENVERLSADDFIGEKRIDMYIADKHFRWTFVQPHETG
jgi:hypothetical protein